MAWSTPMTAVAATGLTAAQWNASVRDNLLVTAPAVATATGRIIVTSAANTVAERTVTTEYLSSSGTTTNTSFVNLSGGGTGPTCTATTGVLGFVFLQCQANNSSGGASSRMSYDVSGATTSAATDDRGTLSQNSASADTRYGVSELQTLTAGSNTFVNKYRVSSGTGSFSARTMTLLAL